MNSQPDIQTSADCHTKKGIVPTDCDLLPITNGNLLVSREHAVFCRIPAEEVDAVRAVLSGHASCDILSQALFENLYRHGFGEPPRPAKPDPPTVQMQLTNDCNLDCSYCCTNSGHRRAQEITLDQALHIVRQIPKVLGHETHVALLGGEPLLVTWCSDLVSHIIDLGLSVMLFTNGIPLADDAIAKEVAGLAQRGLKIRVSLAGPTAASCDSASGGERFENALLGIQKLAEYGGGVSVDLMLTPQNAETVASELSRIRERLPANTPIALGVLYMSGRETGEHLFKDRPSLESALDRVAFGAGVTVPAQTSSPVTYRRDGCSCALGKHVHVRSDGALFNCFKMEEKVGHLDGDGFEATARLMKANPHRATSLPVCADCPLATICGGGCRSENMLYTGNPDEPPCGPWRVRIMSELLAKNRVASLEWPVAFLMQEAVARGIDVPKNLKPKKTSRHLIDV